MSLAGYVIGERSIVGIKEEKNSSDLATTANPPI